jgi:hypothetical protein
MPLYLRQATVAKLSGTSRGSIDRHRRPTMRTIAFSLVLAGAIIIPLAAHANPTCTTEPKAKWLSEDAIKAKIAALGYKQIRSFKVTPEACYEIYGSDKDNKLVEVYFNPVTGEIVPSIAPVVPPPAK